MRCSFVAAVYGLLAAINSVTAILDVGDAHTCATVGTTLKCWGENQRGQLGRGDTNTTGDEPDEMGDNLIAVDLGTGEVASALALGDEHTCVLLASGDVKCFGYNDKGQLGQGDTESRGVSGDQMGDALLAIDLGTGVSAEALTAGCSHNCVLLSDETVKCFGYNNYGQLGQGTTDNIGDDAAEMGDNLSTVPLGDVAISAIAAGCDFTCAVTDAGDVMCWGRNTYGQLGAGDTEDRLDDADDELVTVDLGDSAAHAISAGESHVCALLTDGTMKYLPTFPLVKTPDHDAGFGNILNYSLLGASTKCWGRNNVGQLGLGDTVDRGDTPESLTNLTAVELGSGDVIDEVDLGAFHTCALLIDGSIKCFGENDDGELGIGSTDNVGELPTDMGDNITAVDLGDTATDIAAGGSSSCAILSDDSVKCWGQGSSGQLGQGDDENIGDVPDVLADTPSIDLGSETLSAAPTPSPTNFSSTVSPTLTTIASTVPTTASPTSGSSQTVSPTTDMSMSTTESPTPSPSASATSRQVGSTMTDAPTMTAAPTTTAAPTSTSAPTSGGTDSNSASTVTSTGGLVTTVVLGVVGFVGFSFI